MIHINSAIVLPEDYSQDMLPEKIDVVSLFQNNNIEKLNKTVVCNDLHLSPTATFEENSWDCTPLVTTKNSSHRYLNFKSLVGEEKLLIEIKIIAYGWLFHKSTWTSIPAKFSTIAGRTSALTITYNFLKQERLSSIRSLSDESIFSRYLSHLKSLNKTAGTIVHYLSALQQAFLVLDHMGLNCSHLNIEPTALSKKLCKQSATTKEQNLAIPQKIADVLYGKAIEIVEAFWEYRTQLGLLERKFQDNYEIGQKIVEEKIRKGEWHWLEIEGDAKNKHAKAREANRFQPASGKEILDCMRKDIPNIPRDVNGHWWMDQKFNISIACFICCGAFSGMRESELFELTSKSYRVATYGENVFNLVRAKTHKLGQKHSEWVVSPIVKKAIELISELNSSLQESLKLSAKTPKEHEIAECIWLSRGRRSLPASPMSSTNIQLCRFAKKHNVIVTEEILEECKLLNPNSKNRIEDKVIIGKPWHFTTHQFRRTLAVFTVRHRLGNIIAIKEQYNHLCSAMTAWYTEGGIPSRHTDIQIDEDLKRNIDDEYNTSIANKYHEWMNESAQLSGSHGKAIVAMRGNAPHIYSNWNVIHKAVKDKRLTLHGTMHGYCKSGYDCDMDGVSNPAFCVDCRSGSSIIEKDNATWWKAKHLSLTQYLSENIHLSASEYSHCITQIRAAEVVMKDFDIPHDIYVHPIKVINHE